MNFLDLISKYIVIPGALLYFAGWIYLYTLCRYIALDSSILGLDANSIIANSYAVMEFALGTVVQSIASHWILLLAIVAVTVLFVAVATIRGLRAYAAIGERWLSIVTTISESLLAQAALYMVIVLAVASVSQAAARDYLARTPSRPGARMVFDFKKSYVDESQTQCDANPNCYFVFLKKANDSARLRMLMETPDYFVVWAQRAGGNSTSLGAVYLIKKENVSLAEALDVETCRLGGEGLCSSRDFQ